MIIVLEKARPYEAKTKDFLVYNTIEITDTDLDLIGEDYRLYSRKLSYTYKPLSRYFKELLELARTK